MERRVNKYSAGEIARVYLLDVPYCIDHAYDYFIPSEFKSAVHVGCFVTLPFGGGNRKQIALVAELPEETGFDSLKPISGVCSDYISLDGGMDRLCMYVKEQTLCTVGDAVRCLVPSSAISRLVEYYRPVSGQEISAGGTSPAELLVYNHILSKGGVSTENLQAKFGAKVTETLAPLCAKGLLLRELELKDSKAEQTETVYSLRKIPEGIKLTSAKQKAVVSLLSDGIARTAEEIGVGKAVLAGLLEKGILVKGERVISDEISAEPGKASEIKLNQQQSEAYSELAEMLESGKASAALLHGVTGSGKTCVMLKLIDRALELGRGAIVLLPEIALTPQSLGIFRARYGGLVAVIHSGLSGGERLEAYRTAKSGRARVIIGTRSAIFSPIKNLGVIIIDEEQEHTYKSDQNPKYHARDIARWRCANSNALMLLASATPSLESYQRALEGRYKLIKLTERYGDARLPYVTVADMRLEAHGGNVTPLGSLLTQELVDNSVKHEQSVLFLNRRGYNHLISCRDCGSAITCSRCSVAMNYHTKNKDYDDGELVCHWCGQRMPVPDECPACHSKHLVHLGFGTQRIEQELGMLLPNDKILRMDADTTNTKESHDRILSEFRSHKADVLLGTQMVTKGHDFPDVTLVGVLLADASLYLDDYRANEQTFALLTQVIGRAGRASKPGRAIIQTNNPESDVIKLACAQNYESFYANEIKLRQILQFPPFCDIVMLTLTSADENLLMVSAKQLSDALINYAKTEFSDVKLAVFGPFEAPIYRVDRKYRMRMIIKVRLNRRSRELFSLLLVKFGKDKTFPVLSVDFNPSSLS